MKLKNAFIKVKNKIEVIINRSNLKNKEFTIISNNCWGGMVYQKFGLKYNTPTIGLFFIGEDYIKFCSRLEYYTSIELEFINFNDSKNYDLIKEQSEYPIAKLDDIEVYFMHYRSIEEAREKWNRRCERINFKNILFKISQREGYTKEFILQFSNLPWKNKIVFSYDYIDNAIIVPELKELKGDEMSIIDNLVDYVELLNGLEVQS